MDDEIEGDDEGWIYLTPEERQVFEKQKNAFFRELLDQMKLVPQGPVICRKPTT